MCNPTINQGLHCPGCWQVFLCVTEDGAETGMAGWEATGAWVRGQCCLDLVDMNTKAAETAWGKAKW